MKHLWLSRLSIIKIKIINNFHEVLFYNRVKHIVLYKQLMTKTILTDISTNRTLNIVVYPKYITWETVTIYMIYNTHMHTHAYRYACTHTYTHVHIVTCVCACAHTHMNRRTDGG